MHQATTRLLRLAPSCPLHPNTIILPRQLVNNLDVLDLLDRGWETQDLPMDDLALARLQESARELQEELEEAQTVLGNAT